LFLQGTDILYRVPGNVNQFSGWPINPAAIQTFNPATGIPTSGGPVQLTGFPENLPTPITYRYSLGTEYNFASDWVGKLGYQGSTTHHYTRQTNFNWYFMPLNPRIQSLTFYLNDANANYDALLAEVEHRFSHSFQFDVQYRWSHTIDDGSNDYYIGQYPFGLQYLRGDADFDVRHNLKVYGIWNPRIFKGNGWAEKILGGWQITGILNANSGFPWTPLYSNTGCNVVYANSGYCNLRPAGYLGNAGTDYSNSTFEKAGANFPNGALAYFTVPTFPASGIPPAPSVGRNVLRGPGYFDTDMTLQKSFGLPKLPIFGENARFEFRADFFNIFNKTNLQGLANSGNPYPGNIISSDGVSSNPQFGVPQAGLSGRVINLQARFSF
ncbi:MAG TPA: hypothetical protein VLI55_18255, partial [Bryobacteraceae bacterium]|nr:hypothetical protein [Bryobacteraceae bacterium]